MAKKKSTVASIGEAISGAGSTVAGAVDRNVVQPVGKALGMIDRKPKKAAKKKTVVKAAKVKTVTKKVAPKAATKKK